MCLIIIPVEYVSVTNAGDAEADDRKESHFYLNDRESNKSVLYLKNNKYTKSGFAKEEYHEMSILQRGNDMWFGSESTRNFLHNEA